VSEQRDEGDGTPDKKVDVPPTRKHEAVADAAPPARASASGLSMTTLEQFPDDGVVAKQVRRIDHTLGTVEQGLLFGLLAIVVIVAATAALSDKVGHHQLGRWWHYIVRGGTFSIAMFGAVFATYQQRHLAMDLVSRRMSARGRLVLGMVLKLFTIAISFLLFRSGMKQREVVGGLESLDVFGIFKVSDADIVTTMPIAAAMIMFHCALHIVVDVEYLVRGKLPPERARSGH
jgi:TRAP-type C4-dicarboxylate transport system permease small subunit